jgi:putative SOS response-associated peptidase YedK
MCAQYELLDDWGAGFPSLSLPSDLAWPRRAWPRYQMPIIRSDEDGNQRVELRHWGFIRRWPGKSGKLVTHILSNAKGEEITGKRSFSSAFKVARCLIPLSGWYEHSAVSGAKRRYRLAMKGVHCFAAAGIYETSVDPKTELPIKAYTMLTVAPGLNSPIENIHDRAPLILPPTDYANWLDPHFQFGLGSFPLDTRVLFDGKFCWQSLFGEMIYDARFIHRQ